MKFLRWMLLGALACGQEELSWQPPSVDQVYEVQDLRSAGEYLLEQAVNCRGSIWLRINDEKLSHEDREKLFYLLPGYRIAGLKVYPVGDLYLLMPQQKSCVRMLHYARGHRDIILTEKEHEALDVARNILRELGVERMSHAQAARALHDWIVLHAAYDVQNANFDRTYDFDEYTPFDGKFLLLEGKGVCDSYAQAYWLLLQLSGVPCSMVSGYVPKFKQPHGWNLVFMDDHWAHVDTTFDDPVPDKAGQVIYDNFDKSDAEMRENRSWPSEFFPNTQGDGFLSQKPVLFNSADDFIAWLKCNPIPTGDVVLIEISSLPASADSIARLLSAAEDAAIAVTITHDPIYPKAFRVRSTGRFSAP